ncbi:MAG: glutamate--tRNA ligase family protein [Lachnospiraceae bacterium]
MILIKSDGYPTYNFANVVDDHSDGHHPCGSWK